jgi:SAM-dependent methyltransferase
VQIDPGDFEHPKPAASFDAAYAVESFVHASDAEAFFRTSSAVLRRGGLLMVADDFLSQRGSRNALKPVLQRFRRGWHVRTLVTANQAASRALRHGFALGSDVDLTEHVAVPPAPFLHATLAATWLPLPLPYWQSLRGGAALQLCYGRGLTEYHLLTFEKQ